jgi:hypothetical protein
MISIDFVAGTHGNFLEFVCNKFIAKQDINFLPFNHLGASHLKSDQYRNHRVFIAKHYFELKIAHSSKLVRILFNHDDLLLLSAGCLYRAGNSGIEEDLLEINTYFKLKNNKFFSYLIDSINSAYPDNQISPSNPNCSRFILREFFKFGFKDPEVNGLTKQLNELKSPKNCDMIDFYYHEFYNKQLFMKKLTKLSQWCGTSLNTDGLDLVWQEFYDQQFQKDLKYYCDTIIDQVIALENKPIPKLSMLQESYINGILEKKFSIEMLFKQTEYFKTTGEIIQHLCLK